MKLATLIILLGAISISLLFACMAVIIYVDFPAQQEALLRQGGRALAENLRRQIEPAVITDDRLLVSEAIARAKLSDKAIEYVIVLDAAGSPLASTFPPGVPQGLIDIALSNKGTTDAISFRVGDQPLVDISTPVMGGDLGSVHIGFGLEHIDRFVLSRIIRLSIVFTVMAVGALVAAFGIGKGVGRPLDRVASALDIRSGRWPKLGHIDPGPTYEVKEFLEILKRMIGEFEAAERKRQTYEEKLSGMERMALVGQVAAEVAHEINNPLDGLIETVRYLDSAGTDADKVRKYLPLMKKGLEQIEQTGRRLLSLSRGDAEGYREVFDVCEVIRDTTMLLRHSLDRHGVTVEAGGETKCFVVGNAIATGQTVMNLLLNSTDAVAEKGGRIVINVLSDNGEASVEVKDDGSGIDQSIKEQIFQPFFSTKTVGQSTGLGLAVSRALMRRGGGDLVLMEERCEIGGAKFAVKLIKSDQTSGDYDPERKTSGCG
ncbi:MAG: sensor histidine kinase [Planctomycetota bacterium]|jgi:signal transduction histidine kinase